MTSLDTYIQEKREEFDKEFSEAGDMHSDGCCVNSEGGCDGGTGILDCCDNMRFLNRVATSLIRQTARETVEVVKDIPLEYAESHCVFKDERYFIVYKGDFKAMRTAILASAKEKGLI